MNKINMLKIHILDWEIDDNDMSYVTKLISFPFYGVHLFNANKASLPNEIKTLLGQGDTLVGFIHHHELVHYGYTKHNIYVVRQDSWLKTMAILFHEMIHFAAWYMPEIMGEWINNAIDWVPKRLR